MISSDTLKSNAPPWKIAVALGAIYLIWGSVYLAVRVAVHFWPPFLLVGIRYFSAGLILAGWAHARKLPWPADRRQWRNAVVVGLFMVTGANGGVTWGVQHVESGLSAVLIATVPLWLIVLEALRPGGDRPHPTALIGLGVGLCGVWLLVQPNVGVPGNLQVLMGQGSLLGAALLWAIGSIYSRQFPMPGSFVVGAAIQMLSGGGVLILVGLLQGEVARFPLYVEWGPMMAFLYMVFFGSILAYSTYQWLIRSTRPALVATYAYVNPVVAVLIGVGLAGETLTPMILAGSALVIAAAFLIQRVRG